MRVWILVPAVLLAVAALVGGALLLRDLPRPAGVSGPQVVLTVSPTGRDPPTVEAEVLLPLEDALGTIGDVDRLDARASALGAELVVHFSAGVGEADAALRVQQAVGQARPRLPPDIEATVTESSPEDRVTAATLLVTGLARDAAFQLARRLRERLLRAPGVRDVRIAGAAAPRILIRLDLAAAAARGLGLDLVEESLRQTYGGREGEGLRAPADVQQIAAAPLLLASNIVPLSDVAQVVHASSPDHFALADEAMAIVLEVDVAAEAMSTALPSLGAAAADAAQLAPPGTARVAHRVTVPSSKVFAWRISLQLPPGTAPARRLAVLRRAHQAVVAAAPDANPVAVMSPEGAYVRVFVAPGGDANALRSAVLGALAGVADLAIDVRAECAARQCDDPGRLRVVLSGEDLSLLREEAERLLRALRSLPGIAAVQPGPSAREVPLLDVEIDRDRAAALGLTPARVQRAVATALAPKRIGAAGSGEGGVELWLQAGDGAQDAAAIVDQVSLRAGMTLVPVREVVALRQALQPEAIVRRDRRPVIELALTLESTDSAEAARLRREVAALLSQLPLAPGQEVTVE